MDEDIALLLTQFGTDSKSGKPSSQPNPAPSSSNTSASSSSSDAPDTVEAQLDREIDEIVAMQIDKAITEPDEARMFKGIHVVLQMLVHAVTATRIAALPQLIPLLQRASGNTDAIRIAAKIIDEYTAAHAHADQESTSIDAEAFTEALCVATVNYPFEVRCKLAVYQLWGAKKLGCFTMAKVSIDLLTDAICDDGNDTTTQRIEQAVDHIATMPLKYRLMAAIALYQCVPDDVDCKLRALEAIAQKNHELPDTIETMEFCKIVNQQIYQSRLTQ
jgi:hypothetical protein